MKKSLSPLIAEVLIIGIVFGLFIVLHSWSGGFFNEMQHSSGEKIQKKIDCSLGSITIRSAVYNKTEGRLYVLVRNDGQVDFQNLTVSVFINDNVEDFNAQSLTSTNDLPAGEERSYYVDISDACSMGLVRISTLDCPSIYDQITSDKITFYGC